MEKREAFNYLDTQKSLLSSIIAQPDSIPLVSEFIDSNDFENERYQNIYLSLLDLYSDNKRLTKAELYRQMRVRDSTLLEEDFGLFINPPIDTPESLAQILKEKSIHKKAIDSLKQAVNDLDQGEDTLVSMTQASKDIEQLTLRLLNEDGEIYEDTVEACFDSFASTNVDDDYFIPTPYETLNKYIGGGLKPGQLVTIGARTGGGKTVVGTGIAAAAASSGKSVIYFSIEVPKEAIIKRYAACYGNIYLNNLKPSENKSPELIQRINEVRQDIKGWKMEVIDDSDITIEQIRMRAQNKSKSTSGLDLVIIDYLQLISDKGRKGRTREQVVAEFSREAKKMAKQLGIPVVILVQLNRNGKDDPEDRLPVLDDIRESGGIANDSDIIVLIHRKRKDDSPDPKGLLILDKNRDGEGKKMIQVRCVLEKNIFQDIKREGEDLDAGEEVGDENNETIEQATDFGSTSDIIEVNYNPEEEMTDEDVFGDLFGEDDLF